MILEEWNLNLGSSESILEGLFGHGKAISYPVNVPMNKVAKCLLYYIVDMG